MSVFQLHLGYLNGSKKIPREKINIINQNHYNRIQKALSLMNKDNSEVLKILEDLVNDNTDASGPYYWLLYCYKKRNRREDEIRIAKKAIWVFQHIVYYKRCDRLRKLAYFKKYLSDIEVN
jgi:hypothetical protein